MRAGTLLPLLPLLPAGGVPARLGGCLARGWVAAWLRGLGRPLASHFCGRRAAALSGAAPLPETLLLAPVQPLGAGARRAPRGGAFPSGPAGP